MKKFSILFPILLSCNSGAPPAVETLIDLTHPFNSETIYWPTGEPFHLTKGPEGMTEGGYFYNANNFSAAEHGGTHLDAPYHFHQGRWKVGEIPVERLMGPAAVVDVSAECRENRDYLASVEDFLRWESRFGTLPEGAVVLIRTGFGAYWPDAGRYLGTDERGQEAVAKLNFPGLAPQAARWLAEERRPRAVGIDTASIDYGRSSDYRSHVELAEHNILIFENVANLVLLPEQGARVLALPMKIDQGSGAPLRIVALVAERR